MFLSAFTPSAIPFIAGPGAISSSMILANSADDFLKKIVFIFSISLCLIITYMIFQTAGRVSKALGTIGIRIMQRIMGLLLCVIAIQFIIDGTLNVLNH